MRKILAATMVTVMMFGTSMNVFGGSIPRVDVNGCKILLQNSPFIQNGSTYIPLRAVSENLGAKVDWNAETQTVTITQGVTKIEQKIDSDTAHVNSQVVKLDAPAISKDGVTYVPVRFIAEALGGEISFDAEKNKIDIQYEKPTDSGQQYDFLGRQIRTTDLPTNASEFEYVLMGVPNEMYEMPFKYETTNWKIVPVEGEDFTRPVNLKKLKWQANESNFKIWKDLIEEHLELRLNVDYQTVNDNWSIPFMNTTYYGYGLDERYLKEYPRMVNEYIQYIKENHISIEGDYYVEPSMAYIKAGYRVRCWVKFRINSDVTDKAHLFANTSYPENFDTNVWYQGYCDMKIGTNIDYDGSNLKIVDTDELSRGTYQKIQ